VKVGKWIIEKGTSDSFGIPDESAIERVQSSVQQFGNNQMKLVGITEEGCKVWTLEEEIKEMKGHFFGLIRTVHGREMLDAHKMAILEDLKLGRR